MPPNCLKATLSFHAVVVCVRDYIHDFRPKESICVFVGAITANLWPRGANTFADQYKDDVISITNYSLSTSVACSKSCHVAEDIWDMI